MILLVLFTIVLLLFLIQFISQNLFCLTPRCFRLTANIPGDPPFPYIIWNVIHYFGSPESLWIKIRQTVAKYPKIFKVWGVNRCAVVLMDPNDIEILLTSNVQIRKSDIYGILHLWLQSGLLLSTGDHWKVRRKLLTPAFHFNVLKQFIPVFERCSIHSVKAIAKECSKESSDVLPIVIDHALLTLCETTMGITIDNESAEILKYKKAIQLFGVLGLERLFQPWLWSDPIMLRSSFGKRFKAVLSTLQKFTKNVIDGRLQTWDSSETIKDLTNRKLPMLDLLIHQFKNGAKISYDGIREEVDTFMFEGHDTTGMALSFCLMILANNRDVQDKIYEEQLEIFGNFDRIATYEDLQQMCYLERCLKESLRLYPAVPVIGRHLVEDLVLKDYILPAGVDTFLLIYDLHRNPDVWPDPEKFDPDRFLPENSRDRHPFAYLPFSAGPRNCIGQKFAMAEMKSYIGRLLREYILEPIDRPEKIVFRADMALRPSETLNVKFLKREKLINL